MKLSLSLILSLAAGFAADGPAGEWVWQMPTPQRTIQANLVMKVAGNALTGTFTFEGGREFKIENGTVDGNKVKFMVKRQRQTGGEMVYHLSGAAEGDTLKGTADTEIEGKIEKVEWTARRK